MRRQRTTRTGKTMRMKFLCIISGCPVGARKWHIQIFAMFNIAKNRPRKGPVLHCQINWETTTAAIMRGML